MSDPLKPGDRLLIHGESFPDDELEVITPIGSLSAVLNTNGQPVVKYVKRPVFFILGPEMRFDLVEGLP